MKAQNKRGISGEATQIDFSTKGMYFSFWNVSYSTNPSIQQKLINFPKKINRTPAPQSIHLVLITFHERIFHPYRHMGKPSTGRLLFLENKW